LGRVQTVTVQIIKTSPINRLAIVVQDFLSIFKSTDLRDMTALAIDRTQRTRVKVAPGSFSEFIAVLTLAIHLLAQFT
jgi:hypothetical protein